MKPKNLNLRISSFLVAIGGAFSALSAASPDFIHVQYAGDTFFTCTIADTCVAAPNPCRVQVAVQPIPGGPITPTLVNVYDNRLNPTACTTLLASNDIPTVVTKPKRIIAVKQ